MTYCDHCKWSEFDCTEDVRLICKRRHPTRFLPADRTDPDLSNRTWGWIRADTRDGNCFDFHRGGFHP
jgi:hypothetical protein